MRTAMNISFSVAPPLMKRSYWLIQGSDGTCRVILRILKPGCHPVAIAQMVEH